MHGRWGCKKGEKGRDEFTYSTDRRLLAGNCRKRPAATGRAPVSSPIPTEQEGSMLITICPGSDSDGTGATFALSR